MLSCVVLFLSAIALLIRGYNSTEVEYLSLLESHETSVGIPAFEIFNFANVEAAFAKVRMRRNSFEEVECDCDEGTVYCMMHFGKKYCECENNTLVINSDCKDCYCVNGICDHTGYCKCQMGYAKTGPNTCEECDCGDDQPCSIYEDYKFCNCWNKFLAVNVQCTNCQCGDNEVCYMLKQKAYCDCSLLYDDECQDCDCTDMENKACSYMKQEEACKCIPNYARLDGICIECKCDGKNTKCEFINGTKTCTCKNGFEEHNGSCEECYCGEGHGCTFKNGSSVCICEENHVEHNGTCKECLCNEEEVCEFIDGQKTCLCKENYVKFEDSCIECFCGDGHDCEIIDGKKVCLCQEKFANKNGTCEECNCGAGHTCEFLNGGKLCSCIPGYAEDNGTCRECSCGTGHICEFMEGEKFCWCMPGHADDNGTCRACACGNGTPCIFLGEYKMCFCEDGYVQKGGECHEICHQDTCGHGSCEVDNTNYTCKCDNGFSGIHCDQAIVMTPGATYLISILTAVTLFWILLLIGYIIRKKMRSNPNSGKPNFSFEENYVLMTSGTSNIETTPSQK